MSHINLLKKKPTHKVDYLLGANNVLVRVDSVQCEDSTAGHRMFGCSWT